MKNIFEKYLKNNPHSISEFFKMNKDAFNLLSNDDLELFDKCEKGEKDMSEMVKVILNNLELKNMCLGYMHRVSANLNNGARFTFDYVGDIDKRKKWLIHFTTKVDEIAKDGFNLGTTDLDSMMSAHGELQDSEGYNFAFDADKANNTDAFYYLGDEDRTDWKEGAGAIMFQANGIEARHKWDRQDQVIFWGQSATNFIPIYHGNPIERGIELDQDNYELFKSRGNIDNLWYIVGKNNQMLYYNENIKKVVKWVELNYKQYHRQFMNENVEDEYADANKEH